jgi:chlorobactene glucosyltransferase
MLSQDYENMEMVAVNDRSGDHTSEILHRLAAADGRLKVIDLDHLEEGWCGKNHAMQHGVAATTGEWIVMTDADCRQISPRSLSIAVEYARQRKADMLSMLPNLEMLTFWEAVVQPVCSAVMMIWFHPDKVNDPSKPHAYANGAFMMIRREAYEKMGTHEALKDKLNEDMHMALRVKQGGGLVQVVRNEGLCVVRMYTSLREIIRGWARIYFGTFGTLGRLLATLVLMVEVSIVPYLAALAGLLGVMLDAPSRSLWVVLGLVGLAGVILQTTVIYRFYRLVGIRVQLTWAYLLGCLVAVAALVMSLSKLRKGSSVAWRNTVYVKN